MPPKGKDLFAQIVAKAVVKAWKEPAFKKQLLSNPKNVLEKMGIDFSKNARVRFVENSESEITLVFPQSPGKQIEELSDEEILKVAGGRRQGTLHTGKNTICYHK